MGVTQGGLLEVVVKGIVVEGEAEDARPGVEEDGADPSRVGDVLELGEMGPGGVACWAEGGYMCALVGLTLLL